MNILKIIYLILAMVVGAIYQIDRLEYIAGGRVDSFKNIFNKIIRRVTWGDLIVTIIFPLTPLVVIPIFFIGVLIYNVTNAIKEEKIYDFFTKRIFEDKIKEERGN